MLKPLETLLLSEIERSYASNKPHDCKEHRSDLCPSCSHNRSICLTWFPTCQTRDNDGRFSAKQPSSRPCEAVGFRSRKFVSCTLSPSTNFSPGSATLIG